MSKERDAFLEWIKVPAGEVIDNKRELEFRIEAAREGFYSAWGNREAHYQPLLAAKDAEISELKALLEQAREAFENIEYIAENNAAGIIDDEDFIENDESPEDAISYNSTLIFRVCKKILAAINAATGEK